MGATETPAAVRPGRKKKRNPFEGKGRARLARLISEAENSSDRAREIVNSVLPRTGRAHVIGVTGPPGCGKSTLIERLALQLRKEGSGGGKTVGIIAIDPSSASSGGAFMGNRVRMREASRDRGIFIRSMASRASPGGIPRAACDAIKIMDAAGADCIIIETVGAGQTQTDISRTVHTTVVVVQPESGDIIQAMKAGLMEIGDIIVVNKSDLAGADRTATSLHRMLETGHYGSWVPRVVKVTATSGKGVAELAGSIEEHRRHLEASGELAQRERAMALNEVEKIIEEEMRKELARKMEKIKVQKDIESMVARKVSSHDVAKKLMMRAAGKCRKKR